MHTVFKYENEDWVVDNSVTLTSNPPKYNAYRLLDKKHMYIDCMEVLKYPVVKHIHPDEYYQFVNGYPANAAQVITGNGINGSGVITFAGTGKTVTEIYELDPLPPEQPKEPSETEDLKARVKQLEESMRIQSMMVPPGPDKNLKDDEWHVIFTDYRDLTTGVITKIRPQYASGMNALFKVKKM